MKVIVCGSRSFQNPFTMSLWIDARIAALPEKSTVVHGASPGGGADEIAALAATRHGHHVVAVPISQEDRIRARAMNQPKYAPLARNVRMFDLHADAELCIAFWNRESRGTAHAMEQAHRLGILVDLILEPGTQTGQGQITLSGSFGSE